LRAARPHGGHYTLRAHSGPPVFAQTNDAVADAIADYIGSLLAGENKLLIDAFCGAGFFAKRLAPKFQRVIGIDWDRFAIDAARKDAGPNETYIAGDVAVELAKAATPGDSLIVDPPATGLTAEMRRAILEGSPSTLIYVSCNPPTLARDLAELQSKFSVVAIAPIDIFPQTAEIEVVAHLKTPSSQPQVAEKLQ
jgi:23S rRNA (uracil1939-C5)-methyltransferase